jgi:FlaG/FlaF family flagellin (archaellin)
MRTNENAVSPVVGVMLMLVVTIIIAAVVSGFAGGLSGGTQKAPQMSMDVTIKNTGYAASSYVLFDVQAVSEPIPTNDLKISTFWSTKNATGDLVTGGATVASGMDFPNTHYHSGSSYYEYQSPLGFGAGVSDEIQQKTSGQYPAEQYFGNYTLVPGTTMKNSAGGYSTSGYGGVTPYVYTAGTYWTDGDADGMMAVLGDNWYELRAGDLVDIKITHIPSGKLIFDATVGVEG